MYSQLSRIASNQRSVPLVIACNQRSLHLVIVCGSLSTTGLDLLKLIRIYSDLCWLKNGRMFSVVKFKV